MEGRVGDYAPIAGYGRDRDYRHTPEDTTKPSAFKSAAKEGWELEMNVGRDIIAMIAIGAMVAAACIAMASSLGILVLLGAIALAIGIVCAAMKR